LFDDVFSPQYTKSGRRRVPAQQRAVPQPRIQPYDPFFR
jgi:hypothetical protein